jgi:lysylphosphatidylglycerol synthetase-like protein (DUF2156 family)
MNDLWTRIKAWTKSIIFAAVVLYVVLFIYNNTGKPVSFWWWFKKSPETSVFVLSAIAFFAGVICTLLSGTVWRTWRQLSNAAKRGKQDKIERDLAEIKAKSAMLQTRPSGDGVTVQVDNLGNAKR